ncbi:MAG: ferric reductase-like transmembrane domain-containing protein [Pseudomonadota bacterium]
MQVEPSGRARAAIIWLALGAAINVPMIAAAYSPLLQWRDPVYWLASFSGILGLALMLVQPLLAAGLLPGMSPSGSRRLHRVFGMILVLAVVTHVGALWVTSPPDVIDALLLVSPTPFSVWGVVAMWAVFGAAALAAFRKVLKLKFPLWQRLHIATVAMAVTATIVHALRIEGVMETTSKAALCALAAAALAYGVLVIRRRRRGLRGAPGA